LFTLADNRVGFILAALDVIFLGIYVLEASAKLYCLRGLYFKSGWNIFGIPFIGLDYLNDPCV
jgi:hypothetical protein